MKLKVIIIDQCESCEGEAYIFAGEYKDELGEHPVYRPCHVCKGCGEIGKQVTLQAFQDMLYTAMPSLYQNIRAIIAVYEGPPTWKTKAAYQ